MEAHENKPENDLNHLRKLAISLMARRFNEYDSTDKGIKFKEYSDRKIGEILGYDKSHIYRLLKHPNLREKQPLSTEAIKNIIIRLLTKNDEFLFKDEEVTQPPQKISTLVGRGFILVLAVFTLAFILGRNSLKDELDYAETHYILNDIEEVESAVFSLSSSNVPQLQLEAALFNMDIKSLDAITHEDSITLVGRVKSTTINILGKNRYKPIYHKFVTKKGTPLINLLDRTVPTDSMYACSDSTLAFVKEEDLPGNATLFDRGLVLSLPYLLSQEEKLDVVMKNTGEQVDNVQQIQISKIITILKEEEGY